MGQVQIRIAPGGRFNATGVNVKMLIAQAYDIREAQIVGGPGWISSDRFDISAKAEGDKINPEAVRPMLQALLAERFKLVIQREQKEMSIYALVAPKGAAKLKAAEGPGPMMRMGNGSLTAQKVKMQMLANNLSRSVGRNVIDKTGLTGEYDFKLEWTPQGGGGPGGPEGAHEPPPAADGPTIFTAVQEQLGLKLESQKGPVDSIVIQSIEKPGEN